MSKKKPYFAQNKHTDPLLHRAKYFDTLDEAKDWLKEQGGGTVKQRNAEVVSSSGCGLERVDFEPLLRVWGEIHNDEKE